MLGISPSIGAEKAPDNEAVFSVDKTGIWLSFLRIPMAQTHQKLTSPTSIAIDAVLVVAFFFYIYSVVASHVPSTDHKMIVLWGGLTSAMMSALFWLAVQMFRVVLRFQREQRAVSARK